MLALLAGFYWCVMAAAAIFAVILIGMVIATIYDILYGDMEADDAKP